MSFILKKNNTLFVQNNIFYRFIHKWFSAVQRMWGHLLNNNNNLDFFQQGHYVKYLIFNIIHASKKHPKNAFPEVWLFLKFLAKSNLALFVPLYLLSWRLLLNVDFDRDSSTSWRVFFSLLDVVKGFVFTMERIFWSSTTVVLCRRPVLFMFLSSAPVLCLFFRMYQTVDLATPNVPAISLMDLFCFWSLTIICFTFMERSFDFCSLEKGGRYM